MATSEIPSSVVPPAPCPEPAGTIPATASAIAREVLARHASIGDKLARLDGAPAVVAKVYLANFDPSKVSTAGAHAVEEVEQETPASAILSSFNPGIVLEPISKHAADGLVDMSLPCASLADLKAAAATMLPRLRYLNVHFPESPDKVDLLAPYLRNYRAIEAAVTRALEAVCAPPSRRDAIAAKLAVANAALADAAALGWDFAPPIGPKDLSWAQARQLQELSGDVEAGWLFGGFTELGFISAKAESYYGDTDAFLFSLTNPAGRPERLASTRDGHGVGNYSGYLAILGNASDFAIFEGCASNTRSYTKPGTSYAASSVAGSHPMAQGTVYFTVAELVAWTVPQ